MHREPLASPVPTPRASEPPAPLGAGRYHVAFTAGAETHAKLQEAIALLRHRIPDGDLAKLFDRALDALLREPPTAAAARRETRSSSTTSPAPPLATPRDDGRPSPLTSP